jgi:alkanesulfonate monooxygenase SsuD/methylene tetrahydromethanopterin reductase-like flavin-dependent oxidoreductase (luciferase family)
VKISLFCELPLPRPWDEDAERRMFAEHLEAFALADRLGFHAVWVTEHHFLEEYCHASAPDVFLGALSQRTENLRLGHGIVHMPPAINHPARVAERIATLDVLSNGRVEFGTGEGSSAAELDGFVLDPGKKREMWEEAVRVATRCMAETPFTGFEGEFVTMPPRNVVPKPVQKPHPPLWVACTRPTTIKMAAENGIGALSFAFVAPEEFAVWVNDYYERIENCVPITSAVNANVLCSAGGMVCAPTEAEAKARVGIDGGFFGYGIGHYYVFGTHRPGRTDLWQEYVDEVEAGRAADRAGAEQLEAPIGERSVRPGTRSRGSAEQPVGTPDQLRSFLRRFEATGVDQLMMLLPPSPHESVMESLELFGEKVLPEFIERDEAHVREKTKRMEPIVEAALARRPPDPELDADYSFGATPLKWETQQPITEILEAMGAIEPTAESGFAG